MFLRITVSLLFLIVFRCDCLRSPMNTRDPLVIVNDAKYDFERAQTVVNPELFSRIGDYKKELLGDIGRIQLGNVSSQCVESLQQLGQDLSKRKPYALNMLDAWGKPSAGIKLGNTKWLGRYYECNDVHADNFDGRYCALGIGQPAQSMFSSVTAPFLVAMCMPDTCSGKDTNELVQPLSQVLGQEVGATCREHSATYTATDIATLVISCTLGLLVVLGTAYEFVTNILKEHRRKASFYESDIIPIMEQERSKFEEIAVSFSLIQNTKNLLKTEQREGDIHVLHGLRFISMTWVILGHTYVFLLSALDNIVDFAKYFATSKSFQAIANATYSVDSFFFLSGLLVAYLGLREMKKSGGKMNVLIMYLYRYLRLTPAYAFCILFMVSLYTKLGDGPTFPMMGEGLSASCQKYWWTNLLYINNIYPTAMIDECFGWGWYLANDMQFYLVAPLILLLMYRKPLAGNIVLAFGIVACMAITGGLSTHYKEQPMVVGMALLTKTLVGTPTNNSGIGYQAFDVVSNGTTTAPITTPLPPPPTPSQSDQFWGDLYAKPWCRIAVYFIGMATGFILYDTRGQRRMNKVFVTVMWVVTAVVALSVVYGLTAAVVGAYALPVGVAAFYNAVSRPLWALSLAWVTIACVHGYGGPVNTFLSWKFFIPLSRLTYSCYLVHPLVFWWFYSNREVLMHFEINTTIAYFLATLTLSVGIAYVLAMLVEFPFIGILKVLFPRERHKKENASVAIINDTDDATQA